MWQQIIIALLVVFAAGYVVWTFLPMMSRQRLLDALAAHGVLVRASVRHRARLATPGCSNCAAAGEHAPKIAKGSSIKT
jgi:hypothetical protein